MAVVIIDRRGSGLPFPPGHPFHGGSQIVFIQKPQGSLGTLKNQLEVLEDPLRALKGPSSIKD